MSINTGKDKFFNFGKLFTTVYISMTYYALFYKYAYMYKLLQLVSKRLFQVWVSVIIEVNGKYFLIIHNFVLGVEFS